MTARNQAPLHSLAQLLQDGEGPGLRFERDLSRPPERVWRALTESDQLRHWMPCDIVGERAEGAEVRVPFWDDVAAKYQLEDPDLPGRIVTWDPPRRFVWIWDDELLTFDLEPATEGTRLTLTVRLGESGPGVAASGAGYHVCLDQLVLLVDTDAAPPFVDQDGRRYEPAYAALLERLG